MFKNLNKFTRGILLIITGSIILLYTIGILRERLSLVVIAISVGMIVYGAYLLEGHTKIIGLIKGNKKPHSDIQS